MSSIHLKIRYFITSIDMIHELRCQQIPQWQINFKKRKQLLLIKSTISKTIRPNYENMKFNSDSTPSAKTRKNRPRVHYV